MFQKHFTVVLDHRPGLAPEEEEEQEVTDRTHWEKRSSKITVDMADEVLRFMFLRCLVDTHSQRVHM